MYRIIFCSSVFIIVILSGVVLYLNHSSWKPYRCNAHVNSHIVSIDGNKIELNIDVNVLNAQENKSEWLVLGSLKVMNKNYAIYRKMFISNNNTDFIGFTNSIITREERHPLDNTPDEVWQQYILPERPGVEFYLEQKRLNKNRVLFKGLDNPYFLCTIIEN